MNVRVEASSINVGLNATLSQPVIVTESYIVDIIPLSPTWTCFSLTQLTVNGHSVSAVNPDFTKVGELAASLA